MWMDYGSPAKAISLQDYAASVADYAHKALQSTQYYDWVPLGESKRV